MIDVSSESEALTEYLLDFTDSKVAKQYTYMYVYVYLELSA